MAKPTVVVCAAKGCWTVVAKRGDRCEDHRPKPAAPLAIAPAAEDPAVRARLAAKQAERERMARARAKSIAEAERVLAEGAAFEERLRKSGFRPERA